MKNCGVISFVFMMKGFFGTMKISSCQLHGIRLFLVVLILSVLGSRLLNWIFNSLASCPTLPDSTGLPDLALESFGGSIASIRDTKPLEPKIKLSIFGIRISEIPPPPPETIIRYGTTPGECWGFEGSKGSIVVKLATPTVINGIHLEHIDKTLDPNGTLQSAPKKFQLWGLRDCAGLKYPSQRISLGIFEFEPLKYPLQYFPLTYRLETFNYVELEILTNHGRSFTCIYRFRVHGNIPGGNLIHSTCNCTS